MNGACQPSWGAAQICVYNLHATNHAPYYRCFSRISRSQTNTNPLRIVDTIQLLHILPFRLQVWYVRIPSLASFSQYTSYAMRPALAILFGWVLQCYAKRPGGMLFLELNVDNNATHKLLWSKTESFLQQEVSGSKFAYVWYLADGDENIACAILVAASAVTSNGLRANTDLVAILRWKCAWKGAIRKAGYQIDPCRWSCIQGFHRDLERLFSQAPGSSALPIWSGDILWCWCISIGKPGQSLRHCKVPSRNCSPSCVLAISALRTEWRSNGDWSSQNLLRSRFLQANGCFCWNSWWWNGLGEQPIRDRIDVLDGFYALLIGEWCESDGIYQHWQKQFGKGPDWLLENAAMVHFIATWKPWRITTESLLKEQCPKSQPQLLQVFQKWWSAKAKVCWRWNHQWNPTSLQAWDLCGSFVWCKNAGKATADCEEFDCSFCTCFRFLPFFKFTQLSRKIMYDMHICAHPSTCQWYLVPRRWVPISPLTLNHGIIASNVQQFICLVNKMHFWETLWVHYHTQ